MQADTTICNLALSHLRTTDQITNVQHEDSTEARQCRLHWVPVVKEVLRAYPWRFAMGRWTLGGASETDKPLFGWDYAYKLPTECLRVVGVYGADQREMNGPGLWEKEGNCILSNEVAPLYIKGTQLIDDTNLFDSSFVNALSLRLAAQIAPGVGESKLQSKLMGAYRDLVGDGQTIDSTESSQPVKQEGGWVGAYRK